MKQTRLEEAGDDAAGQAGIKLSARALSLSPGRKLIRGAPGCGRWRNSVRGCVCMSTIDWTRKLQSAASI